MIRDFGTTTDGKTVHAITLSAGDLTVDVVTHGARLHAVRLAGVPYNLTLGAETVAQYEGDYRYHGSLMGPLANRVKHGRAELGGVIYQLDLNDQTGQHCLHSGPTSTLVQVWQVVQATDTEATLALDLPDGLGGFPGNRHVTAHFSVIAPGTLRMQVAMTTDALTFANFANHSYWNLDGTPTWTDHRLRIAGDAYLPTSADLIPSGEIRDVTGTAFDFRTLRGSTPGDPPLDLNYCLSNERKPLREVAWLHGASGVTMAIATTEPGLQLFDQRPGYGSLALEPQFWPDTPHNPNFPSVALKPGQPWEQITEWRFAKG